MNQLLTLALHNNILHYKNQKFIRIFFWITLNTKTQSSYISFKFDNLGVILDLDTRCFFLLNSCYRFTFNA